MNEAWVEGETQSRDYRLDSGTAADDLTGKTLTVVLTKRDGTPVASPGTVVADPDQIANKGKCTYTPAASTFIAADGPYRARFRAQQGPQLKFYPSDQDGERWEISLP